MSDLRPIVLATVLSIFAHLLFFAALTWGAALLVALGVMAEPAELSSQAAPAAPEPLELVVQNVPEPPPDLPPQTGEPAANEAAQPGAKETVINTSLDPENLRESDAPPENATTIAAHHSTAIGSNSASPAVSSPSDPGDNPDNANPDSAAAATFQPSRLATDSGEQDEEPTNDDRAASPHNAANPPADTAQTAPGINAVGSYRKAVGNAIGVAWIQQRAQKKLPPGSVKLAFSIDADGRVSEIRTLSNTSAPASADAAIAALQAARIPPIPPEWLAQMSGQRIETTYTFHMLALTPTSPHSPKTTAP